MAKTNQTEADPALARRGVMLILSSPSGAGKSTLTRNLIQSDPDVQLSISVTTRPKRGSEIDGRHYHFITRKHFDAMRDGDELLEWAEVHGNCYGTPREAVEQAVAAGKDILFDIDWQGAVQVRKAMTEDVVTVFVLPPSAIELRARLERRAEDTPEVIAQRMRNAALEVSHWNEYDYLVINDDLDSCFNKIKSILEAERSKRVRNAATGAFAEKLAGELSNVLL